MTAPSPERPQARAPETTPASEPLGQRVAEVAPEQLCFICNSTRAWFGFAPPSYPRQLWACAEHRSDAEQLRLANPARDPSPKHGVTLGEPFACERCGAADLQVVPCGFEPKRWLHVQCWEIEQAAKSTPAETRKEQNHGT